MTRRSVIKSLIEEQLAAANSVPQADHAAVDEHDRDANAEDDEQHEETLGDNGGGTCIVM